MKRFEKMLTRINIFGSIYLLLNILTAIEGE